MTNMKTFMFLLAVGLLICVSVGTFSPSSAFRGTDEHTEWIAKSLKEMETVKVGITRANLLRVFNEEGGISTKTQRRYAYRDCPYIKVDVEFEAVGQLENSPRDRITKISKPFLEWSIVD